MSAIRELVYSWDPVEEALVAAGCPGAPSVDRIIEDFKRASSAIDVPMDDSRAVGRSEDIDK